MLQSELVAIRTDRPEIQESVPAVADFPEPSDLLNQLRTRRKKSRADLADIEVILELLNQAGSSL
ncbi:MAG: flagellar alpha dynein, partial [Microcoleus sp.]